MSKEIPGRGYPLSAHQKTALTEIVHGALIEWADANGIAPNATARSKAVGVADQQLGKWQRGLASPGPESVQRMRDAGVPIPEDDELIEMAKRLAASLPDESRRQSPAPKKRRKARKAAPEPVEAPEAAAAVETAPEPAQPVLEAIAADGNLSSSAKVSLSALYVMLASGRGVALNVDAAYRP
jgi:hypothetical protein